jgi:hypothetical protein
MTINKTDWAYLRRATMVLSVVTALSFGLALTSYIYVDDKRDLNHGSQAGLLKMKAKHQGAVNQLYLVENYLSDYRKLEKKGFIGKENRLNWVETLGAIADKKKVITIEYNIRAIQPYRPAYKVNASLFQINSSEMVLHMKLLHERDLLDIFTELNQLAEGIYDIKRCKIQRQHRAITYNAGTTNIIAECTLNWFTLQAKGSG